MRKVVLSLIFFSTPCFGTDMSSFLPPDEKGALEFLKKNLQECSEGRESESRREVPMLKEKKQCFSQQEEQVEESPLMVFMSFSVPETIWEEISNELQKTGGVFVLRGIPDNSFKKFAEKIVCLRERGVEAPIQLHPKLFKRYQIKTVPSYVVVDEDAFDKMSGSVSLKYALETFSKEGDTAISQTLFEKLGGNVE